MEEQKFSIQFMVLLNEEPVTHTINITGAPVSLHEKHDQAVVWQSQVKVLIELMRAELNSLSGTDLFADIVPDRRRVGLPQPERAHPVLEIVGTPVLKHINRWLFLLNGYLQRRRG